MWGGCIHVSLINKDKRHGRPQLCRTYTSEHQLDRVEEIEAITWKSTDNKVGDLCAGLCQSAQSAFWTRATFDSAF